VSVSLPAPPRGQAGDRLFLNDGLIQLAVEQVAGNDVHCRCWSTAAPGRGASTCGIDLGISAFTDHDRKCLRFA
jgi:pyruvate kinase